MKRLLLASDSFKGTLSSSDIVQIAQEIIRTKFKDDWSLDYQLIADGGEGTVEAFFSLWGGRKTYVPTVDAEGSPITAPLLLCKNGDALLEVASVVGLPYIKGLVPPLERSTRGLAKLIMEATNSGAKRVYVGLGGSSTNELGMGMLSELGVNFEGANAPTMANADRIRSIDASRFVLKGSPTEFICLSDVSNPLLGKEGATYVYGPQKGYGDCLMELEAKANHIASLYEKTTSKSLQKVPRLGASGGLGAAFYTFFDAKMESGIDILLNESNFAERAAKADLIITGEGSFDAQSLQGKAFSGISSRSPKGKLAVLCGFSNLEDPPLPVYETSRRGNDLAYTKKRAKEGYASALARLLEKYR